MPNHATFTLRKNDVQFSECLCPLFSYLPYPTKSRLCHVATASFANDYQEVLMHASYLQML